MNATKADTSWIVIGQLAAIRQKAWESKLTTPTTHSCSAITAMPVINNTSTVRPRREKSDRTAQPSATMAKKPKGRDGVGFKLVRRQTLELTRGRHPHVSDRRRTGSDLWQPLGNHDG